MTVWIALQRGNLSRVIDLFPSPETAIAAFPTIKGWERFEYDDRVEYHSSHETNPKHIGIFRYIVGQDRWLTTRDEM